MYKSRMKDTIAPAVLEIIMSKNVDQGLHDAGFSVSKVNPTYVLHLMQSFYSLIASHRSSCL